MKVNSLCFVGSDQTYHLKAMKRSVLLTILPVLALSFWADRAVATSSFWNGQLTDIYSNEEVDDDVISGFNSLSLDQTEEVRHISRSILLEMRILL